MSLDSMQKHLECPVCFELMDRVVQCKMGHSVCFNCSRHLRECPICRGVYTGTRNFALEDVVRHFRIFRTMMMFLSPVPSPPAAAAASPPFPLPVTFTCRFNKCGVRRFLSRFYNHLRTAHKPWFFEYDMTFSETRKKFTCQFLGYPELSANANTLRYINLTQYGLFVLFFRVKDIGNQRMLCSSWIQMAGSTDSKAQEFSFTIKSELSNDQSAVYTDYVHGEESTECNVLANNTCFSMSVRSDMEKILLDVEIFMTTRELGYVRRNRTSVLLSCLCD